MVHLIRAIRVLRVVNKMSAEVKILLITMAVIVGLPIFSVAAMTSAGLAPISAALVAVDAITHLVSVKDAKGNVIRTFEATTAWPAKGIVTTEFGGVTNYQSFHTGIDIAGAERDPITPFLAGKVIRAVHDPNDKGGAGLSVTIDHGNGITSLYGHMSETIAVEGQDVKPGDVIGLEGHTGHVQGNPGTHVHFEVRVASLPVNPRTFMIGNPPR